MYLNVYYAYSSIIQFTFYAKVVILNIMIDEALIDSEGNGIQFYGTGLVQFVKKIDGQPNVYLLQTVIEPPRATQVGPEPGQFYMVRCKKSGAYFGRPISVYHSKEILENGKRQIEIQFMILEKGTGTKELCHCISGEEVTLSGPMGNTFAVPESIDENKTEVCIVGGGIGVAPVANFASSLKEKSYDFFASFRSGSYGLENVKPRELLITTDDGSQGIHGMLSAALTAEKIKSAGYKCIFACGPEPMLAYVQKVAKETGVKAYLSLEHRMLCGAGACLGCTIQTDEGTLRVCKDGPVFDSDIIHFAAPGPRKSPLAENEEPDLSVDICGVHFKNPVIAASGTFGYGQNFRGLSDVSAWGGISSKGTTLEPRQGNPGERSIEVASGDINSIGLQNPGMEEVVNEILPEMLKLDSVIILNVAGHDLDSYVKAVQMADSTDVKMIELNISCPNVKAGGQAWGMVPEAAFQCVSAVRAVTKKPLIVKLTPNAPDLRAVARACIDAGADVLSLVNTFLSTAIDIEKGKPFFENIRAGLCGPAIKPIALRMVYDVVEEINKMPEEKRVPVIGIGGIEKWQDAVEFIMAGASAIQIGSATFANPNVAQEVCDGLKSFMKRKGYKTVDDFKGIAQVK